MGADLFSLLFTSYKRGANVVIILKSKKVKVKNLFEPRFVDLLDCFKSKAQRSDGKPGRELALWAEGFFRLDLLLLFYQEKSSSLRGNEQYH